MHESSQAQHITTNTTYGMPMKHKQDTLRAFAGAVSPALTQDIKGSLEETSGITQKLSSSGQVY